MSLHSETGESSGKNFMTKFCRGTLANVCGEQVPPDVGLAPSTAGGPSPPPPPAPQDPSPHTRLCRPIPEHCKKSQGGRGEEGGRGRGGKGFGLREGASNCNGGWGGTPYTREMGTVRPKDRRPTSWGRPKRKSWLAIGDARCRALSQGLGSHRNVGNGHLGEGAQGLWDPASQGLPRVFTKSTSCLLLSFTVSLRTTS